MHGTLMLTFWSLEGTSKWLQNSHELQSQKTIAYLMWHLKLHAKSFYVMLRECSTFVQIWIMAQNHILRKIIFYLVPFFKFKLNNFLWNVSGDFWIFNCTTTLEASNLTLPN